MGFKWFRARLSMKPKYKGLSRQPEFYRSMSQFDSDVQIPIQQSSKTREYHSTSNIHSVPTTPGNLVNSPKGTLDHSEIREGDKFKASSMRQWELSSDDEDTPEDRRKIPPHLPRESIELMRGGSAEASPSQMTTKSRKADFKKKKARAPMPNAVNNGLEDSRKNKPVDKGKSSDGSEMEI